MDTPANNASSHVRDYLDSSTGFPGIIANVRSHLAQNPDCHCALWLPRIGGVSSLSDLAPDCLICNVATFWGSGRWERDYDDDPATLTLFSYLKSQHPREDDADPDDYWAYVCECCWNREIINLR